MRSDLLTLLLVLPVACCSPQAQTGSDLPLNPPEEISAALNDILSAATELEILALHPILDAIDDPDLKDHEQFHRYAVLGRAKLADKHATREVLSLVYRGIHDSDGSVASCFSPRHGVRVRVGADEVDFVICYECLSLDVHHGGKLVNALTSEGPRRELDAIWTSAGLSLAQRD